ncbi:DUF4062 domain-containing protein [Shewanella sp. 3_MG-2023]|uniref:ATP-binding protein n=1 Tax=Shewanella sp. 3_MG-2023 TaxID=3062635 RepID=UPI0026E1DF3A|nr:ATP-binding protein [Shewanella sp. 3_MG-2023]MDO6774825.1 DUF4062 domain-containing protein [Shewanella sp. 3_MG-2023]
MTNSKTFRLFISSTFSDFKREREVLQSNVFPQIKNYAAQQGYTFQPIDLRWGVSNEAQLDQKTLELCLDEVKACKTFKHPNFLVMLGDRYGWVPLPYAIEALEFEMLCALMTEKEKQNLANWYLKDLNQLPISYILQERTGDFEAFECWEKEEEKLRAIIQSAAEMAFKNNSEQRKKYFISATEAEVEEGIISYLEATPSQKKLNISPEIDAQNVFGFFRSIEPSSRIAETFIADAADNVEAQKFKNKVKKVLLTENKLHAEVKQVDKNKLDENYLQGFQERVTQFLESKIDAQKENEEHDVPTALEIEQKEQEYFAQNKRKNFLGQEKLLKTIADYISDNNQQPLVIYGKSGCGKSALMAQAIQQAEASTAKKVLYRFVGATANSSSSVDILTSLFTELEIKIHDEDSRNLALIEKSDNKETFEQFSLRVHQELNSIRGEVVIFIDAVDQLQSADYFLWLPKILPINVKIVISALNDDKYAEDSQYFNDLSVKTSNQYPIPEFNDAPKLIRNLLKGEGRTLQPEQERYLLKQYEIEPSPLYIRLAIQEAKQWRCIVNTKNEYVKNEENEANEEIQGTHVGIIQTYIQNLTEIYHHDREFVNRVLGYIYSSKDGLSEYELLTVLSMDQHFVDKVAPTTFHNNITQELPLIHWTRLYNNLKNFLSIKQKDNSELMYFFHREISRAITKEINLKEEHESIINAVQSLIINHQNQSFESNRWGKLYITLITEYERCYPDNQKYQTFVTFLSDSQLLDCKWIEDCVYYITSTSNNYYINNEIKAASLLQSISVTITELLYNKDKDKWKYQYASSLNLMAESCNKEGRFKDAIQLGKKAYEVAKLYYPQEPIFWRLPLLDFMNNLCSYYTQIGKPNEMLDQLEDDLIKFKENVPQSEWANLEWKAFAMALNTLGGGKYRLGEYDNADALVSTSRKIYSRLFQYKKNDFALGYVEVLINYSNVKNKLECYDEAYELIQEAVSISSEFYEKYRDQWVGNYVNSLKMLSTLISNDDPKQACIKLRKAIELLQKPYGLEPARWLLEYVVIVNNLVTLSIDNYFFDGIKAYAIESMELANKLYSQNPMIEYAVIKNNSFFNLSRYSFLKEKNLDKAIYYMQKHFDFSKEIYGGDSTNAKESFDILSAFINKKSEGQNSLTKSQGVTLEDLVNICLSRQSPRVDAELLNKVLQDLVIVFDEHKGVFTQILNETPSETFHESFTSFCNKYRDTVIGLKR